MSYIVTGGAGFIGSCVVHTLNEMGIEDILIVDNISTSEKWLNIRNKKYTEYIHKKEFLDRLPTIDGVSHIIHLGACSATTELDFDYLYQNNMRYTTALWRYAAERKISFLYASSAATYGDGQAGFNDQGSISKLNPLNRYGYIKHTFDLWAEKQKVTPLQHVGMKFFNVYGPNEYAKGSMASVIFHGYNQIKDTGKIRLFKSYRDRYEDGGQKRDFIYVKDVCQVIRYFLEHPEVSGLFNVGTGRAESFLTLAESVFSAMGLEPDIEFIEMPEPLREKYQYFTEASVEKLRHSGYIEEFHNLKSGVEDYVQQFLCDNQKIF